MNKTLFYQITLSISNSDTNFTAEDSITVKEILQIKNVRYFLMFRSSYFARFYYPAFTLLYLDYGLTLSQFAMLSVVWAATIVISEVPSGVLSIGISTIFYFSNKKRPVFEQ
jgi:hypothetical protein